ncbi:hypothetical protein ACHAW5_010657 [Stephanodiscus triporus]|uniref:Uncharacterized protein n=1 Tax=Stephanodiscus triporus TaxID=2934178 RepID=A0ABD3PTV5_9STRA
MSKSDCDDFGTFRKSRVIGRSPIPDKGIRALTKVLYACRESLGLEFCPLLPDLTCILLSYMPVFPSNSLCDGANQ